MIRATRAAEHPRRLLEEGREDRHLLALDCGEKPQGLWPVQNRREASNCSPLLLPTAPRRSSRGGQRPSPLRQPALRESRPLVCRHEPGKRGRQDAEASSLGLRAPRVPEGSPAFRRKRACPEVRRSPYVSDVRARAVPEVVRQARPTAARMEKREAPRGLVQAPRSRGPR